jgi:cytochrome c
MFHRLSARRGPILLGALIFCFVAATLALSARAAEKSKAGDAGKGKEIFSKQCVTCHNATSTDKKIGPGLKGVFQRDKLANGKKGTEANIRAQIENGGNGMPAYKDMLTGAERNDVVAYLKTL